MEELRASLSQEIQGLSAIHSQSWRQRFRASPMTTIWRSSLARLAAVMRHMQWTITVNRRVISGPVMALPFPACWDVFTFGCYIDEPERRLTQFLIKNLASDAKFVDAGANVGFFTVLASQLVGDNGQVLAFEPGHLALDFLHRNAGDLPNVTIFEQALADEPGTLQFFEASGAAMVSSSTVKSHVAKRFVMKSDFAREVCATTLDACCQANGLSPDVVKIDVEGAEFAVLQGARQVLEQHHPIVVLEIAFDEYDEIYRPCVEFLAELGYAACALDEDGIARRIDRNDVAAHGRRCVRSLGYVHGLDNIVFSRGSELPAH